MMIPKRVLKPSHTRGTKKLLMANMQLADYLLLRDLGLSKMPCLLLSGYRQPKIFSPFMIE